MNHLNYKARKPANPGRLLCNLSRPFHLFLRVGGPVFLLHMEVGSAVLTVRPLPAVLGARKKP
jgi:hypothetical protein